MHYVSTQRQAPPVSFSEALQNGLAPDGGLYVPAEFPRFDLDQFDDLDPLAQLDVFAERFLHPFLEGDALARSLRGICRRAFDFPLPQKWIRPDTAVLELFHGPTAAFKDFGARFLAECFDAQPDTAADRPTTILVATSGDTGGAVASAFHRRRGIRVGILFPQGGVSPRQEAHLTCWDDNVRSFAVKGSFDDCQRVVKQAFREHDPQHGLLSSANSINIGRLLPQTMYYAAASLDFKRRRDEPACYAIPSGNMGNAVGGFWAKHMGFPIHHIGLACNANQAVPDFFSSGRWQPRASVTTLANAMDVGDPSNMERLFQLYDDVGPLQEDASSLSVSDATIRQVIAEGPERWGEVWCPHTATAVRLREQRSGSCAIVATAHPAKFEEIVEPLVGQTVEVPAQLAELLSRPTRCQVIEAEVSQLTGWLNGLDSP